MYQTRRNLCLYFCLRERIERYNIYFSRLSLCALPYFFVPVKFLSQGLDENRHSLFNATLRLDLYRPRKNAVGFVMESYAVHIGSAMFLQRVGSIPVYVKYTFLSSTFFSPFFSF